MILNDVIIPSGEKIKQIRKLLGMKQEELTNGKITRNLISYIENGKTRLMPDTAEIIAGSINNKSAQLGNGMIVTAEYLLEDEISQAYRILKDIADELRHYKDNEKRFMEEVKRAETIIDSWDIIDGIGEIYRLIGEFYYNKAEYLQSYFFNLKALESYIRESNIEIGALVALELSKCSIELQNYDEAIIFNSYGLSTIKGKEGLYKEIYKRALFNNALAYKKLNNADRALTELEKLELVITDLNRQEVVDVGLLRGNCYLIKGEYEIALGIYNKLLNSMAEEEGQEILPVVYNNIAATYYEMCQYERALQHFFKSYDLSRYNEEFQKAEVMYKIGKIYSKIGKYDMAEKHLIIAVEDNKGKKDVALLLDTYRLLLNIYYKIGKEYSIRSTLDDITSLQNCLKDIEIYKFERLLNEAAYYYLEKDTNFSKNLLKLGLSFQDEII